MNNHTCFAHGICSSSQRYCARESPQSGPMYSSRMAQAWWQRTRTEQLHPNWDALTPLTSPHSCPIPWSTVCRTPCLSPQSPKLTNPKPVLSLTGALSQPCQCQQDTSLEESRIIYKFWSCIRVSSKHRQAFWGLLPGGRRLLTWQMSRFHLC